MNDYREDFEVFCAAHGITDGVAKETMWGERVIRGYGYSEYPNPQNIPRRVKPDTECPSYHIPSEPCEESAHGN